MSGRNSTRTFKSFYTTAEVAEVFAVKPKTVRGWIVRGEIGAVKLSRRWRVPTVEVQRLVGECRNG